MGGKKIWLISKPVAQVLITAQYWSVALVHAAFLHNRQVHSRTKRTLYEDWFGVKPNLRNLRMFGARVCAKRTGQRRAKLDHHDPRGMFLGYPATMANIVYLDLDSGRVKTCGHAKFDEAWYFQTSRPPVAQLIYDLDLIEGHPWGQPSTKVVSKNISGI